MKIAPEVRKLAHLLVVLPVFLLPMLYTAPAHAANAHSWVSHSGSDANDCTAVSPCATFSNALVATSPLGRVSCLDSGAFGVLLITFSVTIDCYGVVATPSDDNEGSCVSSILITAPGGAVTLRGLDVTSFAGLCNANPLLFNTGILIEAAAAVYIEDSVIENFPGRGIVDRRATGLTKLTIKNTIVRNNGSAGIVAASASTNSVVLENVQSVGNTYGIGVATGNNVVISRSVMSENSVAGIEADSGATVFVDNSEISHNASFGIFSQGLVSLSNSDLSFNTSSIAGSVLSYGNNRIFSNGAGNAPSLIAQQ